MQGSRLRCRNSCRTSNNPGNRQAEAGTNTAGSRRGLQLLSFTAGTPGQAASGQAASDHARHGLHCAIIWSRTDTSTARFTMCRWHLGKPLFLTPPQMLTSGRLQSVNRALSSQHSHVHFRLNVPAILVSSTGGAF